MKPASKPLATFCFLSYALTWALLPLSRVSVVFSLLALFGPAVAAVIAARRAGPADTADLWSRMTRWRVGMRWYLTALLLPLPITAFRSVLEQVLGSPGPVRLQPITSLDALVFLLVVGEEAGWRGFALPRLIERVGPARASVMIGLLWAGWHFPLFYMPGMPQYGSPVLPYFGYTIALSFILTSLTLRSGGSVIIATAFHGAVNAIGIVSVGTDPELRGWTNALIYGLCAVAAGLLTRTHPTNGHPLQSERHPGGQNG